MQRSDVIALVLFTSLSACRAAKDTPPAPAITPSATGASSATAPVVPSATASAAAPASAAPAVAAGVEGAGIDPEAPPDFGEPGVATIEPKVPPFVMGMMDHSHRFGWTSDSKEFGYCVTNGGMGGLECGFLEAAGNVQTLRDYGPGNEEADPKRTAALNARIAKHAVGAASWRFARDLVIVWEATGAPESESDKTLSELRAGARVRDATSTALPIRIRAKDGSWAIHAEAIALSPDGKRLGVLSHAFAGEFSDTFELRSFSTDELAAQAYNGAGLELHRRGEHAKAAVLFHRAAHADARAKLPIYNLACALARLGDPKARKALELAIARGGPEVKTKARRDPDFENVRQSPWFTELVP